MTLKENITKNYNDFCVDIFHVDGNINRQCWDFSADVASQRHWTLPMKLELFLIEVGEEKTIANGLEFT